MRKVLLLLGIVLFTNVVAQDSFRMGFYPVINADNIEESGYDYWYNSLNGALTKASLSNAEQTRFVCGLNLLIEEEEMTANGSMHIVVGSVQIITADIVSKNRFDVFTIENLKGAGKTRMLAEKMIAKNLKKRLNSEEFRIFIESSKDKIINYYTQNCEIILNESKNMAKMKNFDEAIANALSIPDVVSDCYSKGQELAVDINTQKFEFECESKIAEAKNAISSNNYEKAASVLTGIDPTVSCYADAEVLQREISKHWCSRDLGAAEAAWANRDADMVSFYLRNISADSDCYDEAIALRNKVGANLDAIDKREWDLKVKQYEDQYTLDTKALDAKVEEMERQGKLESQRIEASRQVGIEFARNQPKERIKIVRSFPW